MGLLRTAIILAFLTVAAVNFGPRIRDYYLTQTCQLQLNQEYLPSNFEELVDGMNDAIHSGMKKRDQNDTGNGDLFRAVHPKHHGCGKILYTKQEETIEQQ